MHKQSRESISNSWLDAVKGDLKVVLFAFAQDLRLNNISFNIFDHNGRGFSLFNTSYYYAYARSETRPCYSTQKRRT